MGGDSGKAGEYSKPAFLAGRLDLSRAEAVVERIGASSESARRAALLLLQGAPGERLSRLKERLLDQVAAAEAHPAHGDEEVAGCEIDPAELDAIVSEIRELVACRKTLDNRPAAPRVFIAGAVNA